MFDNKTFNFLILGVFLLIIYICYNDNKNKGKKKKEFFNDFDYISKISEIKPKIKSILKKKGCQNYHEKRVKFILPGEEATNLKIPKTQFEIPLNEKDNELCLNNKLDTYNSYHDRLERIKNCKNIEKPLDIKDVYDSLIVDYKRDIDKKKLTNLQNPTGDAAFGLSSYLDTNWNYENENPNNSGQLGNNLYANDPLLDINAKI
jgi:hypothetical protein